MWGRPFVRRVIALACLALGACGGASSVPQRVLLIVLDTTHADQLGCQGGPADVTPHIDALAAAGMRFDRALANTTWTLPSTASLMTGRLPYTHGVLTTGDRMPDDALLMAEMFAAAGWRTAAFVQMVYASDGYGLGQGFEHTRYYSKRSARPPDAEVISEAMQWMDATEGQPSFLYLHLRRPHSPYQPGPEAWSRLEQDCPLAESPDGRALARVDSMVLPDEGLTDAQRRHVEHLYLGNLATIDASLEPLLSRALASDDTLVVMTSDHGEGLGQHGDYGHGNHLHAESVDIPLIFVGPGIDPGVDDRPASTVDMLPTLVELCALTLPAGHGFDGRSLAPRLAGRSTGTPAPVVLVGKHRANGTPEVGLVEGDYKLVLAPNGKARLHHRRDDRSELTDLRRQRPEVLVRMRAAALTYRREHVLPAAARASGATPELTTAEQEALAELGYAGNGQSERR